jgi:hypothetical protein
MGNRSVAEERGTYRLAFGSDGQLQELVPSLVHKRVLAPIEVPPSEILPDWAKVGVLQQDNRIQWVQSLLEELTQQIKEISAPEAEGTNTWGTWKTLAVKWAELNTLWFDRELKPRSKQKQAYARLCTSLDQAFYAWLKTHYAPLGVQCLPAPKHVYHIPHYLAYLRSQGKVDRLALFVLDGLSLLDWLVIRATWRKRHPDWIFQADQLLAQIPTITSLSRYALISGLRPADFAVDMENLPSEAKKWNIFWANQGVPEISVLWRGISLEREDVPSEIESPRLGVLCLIDDTLDELTHNAILGTVDQQSSLRLWLDQNREPNSARMETLIGSLLDRQFTVFIASDHGHVEAVGFGQPSEGLLAQERGKRARLYIDRHAARRVQDAFPDTVLWENDGLNPASLYALMPVRRNAFSPSGSVVVTHGGISIDEVVVPFVQINK